MRIGAYPLRRLLGQHLLTDDELADRIVEAAEPRPRELVMEIGAGKGILTERLARSGATVVSFEIDAKMHQEASERLRGRANLELVRGDAFGYDRHFDLLVSSLPYSASSRFVEWLSARDFSRAVVLLQKDFVEKLRATPGEGMYRAISALAQSRLSLDRIMDVPPAAFDPPPKVHSTLIRLKPISSPIPAEVQVEYFRLFSQNGRNLIAALKVLLGKEGAERVLRNERLVSLSQVKVEKLEPEIVRHLAEMIAVAKN